MSDKDTDPRIRRLLAEWAESERAACCRGPGPGLMERLDREMAATVLDGEIRRAFPWVAVAALAASVVMAWINLSTPQDAGRHPLEALFGLPRPTLEDSLLVNL